MSKTTLALDLGRDTGWALARDNIIYASGTLRLGKYIEMGQRGIILHNWLKDFRNIDELVIERVMAHGPSGALTAQAYGGYLMVISMFKASLRIPMSEIFPTTMKKVFVGHGGADKEDVCARARYLGWKGTDNQHDEADAIGLLFTHYETRGWGMLTFEEKP